MASERREKRGRGGATVCETPKNYLPGAFHPFAVTVDLTIFTLREDRLHVLLVRRGEAPYKGAFALPGGFVRPDESLEEAARRELQDETNIKVRLVEQLGSYGDPARDPRMRVVTVAFLAIAPDLPHPKAGTDASDAKWTPIEGSRTRPKLAFDHEQILADALERVRAKFEYMSLATHFCSTEFTLAELCNVYEATWSTRLDPANFRRKVLATKDFVVRTNHFREPREGGGKPARLYRAGEAVHLHPPMRRGDYVARGRRRLSLR